MNRSLRLRKDTLAELAAAELRLVAAGDGPTTPITGCVDELFSDRVRTCATLQASCVSCYGSCKC